MSFFRSEKGFTTEAQRARRTAFGQKGIKKKNELFRTVYQKRANNPLV
jgi:hypothetical protein